MEKEIERIKNRFYRDCADIKDISGAEEIRIRYLGRKTELNTLFSKIPTLPASQRGSWGRRLNVLKEEIARRLEEKINAISDKESKIDLTFPARRPPKGSIHVLSSVNRKICEIFKNLGFSVVEGDEIADEWHNFESLNIPAEHPSRDVFDTFYLDIPAGSGGKYLLRSHTSTVQGWVMKNVKPPFAVISPGRVYRPDEVDATHSFMFNQIEGFVVDKEINFSHLKGVLLEFAREFYSPDIELRFRPHFFPFTEPSAEVDISCMMCKDKETQAGGKTCSVCKGKGWIEVLGCGMIHPHVFNACGIDPSRYRGFAFGMGIDRIAMLKYSINDIRFFYSNDIRFLNQFPV
ncbi:MAG: phenylalanine--tRNA ligase subunit alpha [Candidatus Omnitrophica bacterium]|nr:phenylalanine--tRNA ligase subunit alpha [Candidatus Omnitrophota bacterium]MBD3269760.1 phenylalanine--tRNA ligase subunit alpha [Candidatus Omnitrophota bacterium]